MASRAATTVALLALLGASAACTHFAPVPLAPRGARAALPAALKPGDTVEVLDRGQRRRRFVVTGVDAQAIEGEGGVSIAIEDVEAVSVRRLGPALPGSGRGGPWGVLGALLGGAVAVLIAIAIL
jgi:hypothetical protein